MAKTRISSRFVAGLAACLLLVASQSPAALVTHVFTGDVTDPGECGAQCVGQQFTAIFQYDTETLPLLDTALVRQWSLADFTFNVSVGPVSDLSGGEGTLHLSNSGGGSGDVFSASGSNAGFLLIDTDATALSSVDLPLALNISDFEIADFFISWPLDSATNIQGQITQIETVVGAVPLPGAFLLLGSGLSLLGWLKRVT